jgi:hypothetical protein
MGDKSPKNTNKTKMQKEQRKGTKPQSAPPQKQQLRVKK